MKTVSGTKYTIEGYVDLPLTSRSGRGEVSLLLLDVAHVRGSTIGEGGDTMISSPGRSPKQPLPGIGLHDPQHGWQACPEFITFDQGVGQIFPR